MARKRLGAFTLAELMVYIGVLTVFTAALYSVLLLSLRHFRHSEARSDSLQSGLKAVTAMNRSLASGASSTLQIQMNPPAFFFLSAEPPVGTSFAVNANGELLWQKWVCFHLIAQERRLVSSVTPISPTPTPPAPPTFAAMLATPARTVANNIANLELVMLDAATLSYTLTTGVAPSISTSFAGQDNLVGVTTSGTFTFRN